MKQPKILQPHQQRVVDERAALDESRLKLDAFLRSDRSKDLDLAERGRMERQQTYMALYSVVLGERIDAFA